MAVSLSVNVGFREFYATSDILNGSRPLRETLACKVVGLKVQPNIHQGTFENLPGTCAKIEKLSMLAVVLSTLAAH